MKNKHSIIKLFLVFIIPLFLFQNCSKETDEVVVAEEAIQDNSKLLEILKQWGYTDADIEEHPNSYIVSGDIVFYKNKEYLSPEEYDNSEGISSKTSNQKQDAYFPASVTNSTVNVYLNPGMDGNWESASVSAMSRWNNFTCSSLNLVRVWNLNEADIEILYDTDETDPVYIGSEVPLDIYTFGRGDWPSEVNEVGIAGEKIWINPDFVYST